jgi:2-methylcitrate dehydratase
MSAFSRNICSTASRTIRQRASISCKAVRPIALAATARTPVVKCTAIAAPFSTMPTLRLGAAVPAAAREFDPEITDVANYVHNVKVESDLAVSRTTAVPCCMSDVADSILSSSTLPDGSS